MNKKNLIIIFSLFIATSANSQITKGNWIVGGTASYSSSKTVYSGSLNVTVDGKSFTIRPRVGYFFADKLAGGIGLYYNQAKQFNNGNLSTNQINYGIGPFVRYYFLNTDKILNIFTEGAYSYDYAKQSDIKSTSVSLAGGCAIFLNSSVGLEFSLKNIWYGERDGSCITQQNDLSLEIGFQIHLEKEK